MRYSIKPYRYLPAGFPVFFLLILFSCQKGNIEPVKKAEIKTTKIAAGNASSTPVLQLSASYSPSSRTINVGAQLLWPEEPPSDAALYKIEVKTNSQDIGPSLSSSFTFNAPQLGSLPITVRISGTVYDPGGRSVASAAIDLIINPDGGTSTINTNEIIEFDAPVNPAPYTNVVFNHVSSNYYGPLEIYAFYFPGPTSQGGGGPPSIFLGKIEFEAWSFTGVPISFNAPSSSFFCDLQHIRIFVTKKDYAIEYFTYPLKSIPTKHLIDFCYSDVYYYSLAKGIGNSLLYSSANGKNRTQIGFLDPMLGVQIPYFQASKDLYPYY